MRAAPIIVRLMPEDASPGRSPAPFKDDTRQAQTARPDPGETTLAYAPGGTLAQAVYLSGEYQPPVLCSGLARCGRCRMRILAAPVFPVPTPADALFFSPAELDAGFRLSCRHAPQPGMLVELPAQTPLFAKEITVPEHTAARAPNSLPLPAGKEFRNAPRQTDMARVLAIDLGTTSMQWRHLALPGAGPMAKETSRSPLPWQEHADPEDSVLWEGSMVNPQMGAGSDVVSRLAAAAEPRAGRLLRDLTLKALRAVVESAQKAGGGNILALCLAANPAMTAICLGSDLTGLSKAPYSLPFSGGDWAELPDLPPAWIPPQLSPFVGGDVSAGYAFLALHPSNPAPAYPFLLADLGTNGEFLLALAPDKAYTASVALGPALEGTGLFQGTEARPGAISRFFLNPQGVAVHRLPEAGRQGADAREQCGADPAAPDSVSIRHTPCAGQAPGITGTGYISLIHMLLQCGMLHRDGHFSAERSGPLHRFFNLSRPDPHAEASLQLPLEMRLHASDVEELLKVKAAFSLGLQRLLQTAGLESRKLAKVFLAGALGQHMEANALENLGFFPQGMASRIQAVGNSSLEGAALLLQSEQTRAALVKWATRVTSVDLAQDPVFLQDFASHMRFAW